MLTSLESIEEKKSLQIKKHPNEQRLSSKQNLSKILENTLQIFQQKIKNKKLNLIIQIEKNVISKNVDSFQIQQVFINLIDNAIKYTDKGSITISLKKIKKKKVVFTIQDTGIGIPEKDQNKIFERFYVVNKNRSRKTGGTGLGLSIVKHIILNHNGFISVKNNKQGSVFKVVLPV